MSILDRRNPAVFISSPFRRPMASFPGISRERLEEDLVGLCAVNPLAMRLVEGAGFRPYFLKSRPARGVFKWLLCPPAQRRNLYPHPQRLLVVGADVQYCDAMVATHGVGHEHRDAPCDGPAHCPWCAMVYRREATTALNIACHLMRAYDAAQQRDRRWRELARDLPPSAGFAIIDAMVVLKQRRIQRAIKLKEDLRLLNALATQLRESHHG
jgi:hypothetical protein